MIISERIFEILAKKKMSQKQFSEYTGISQSTISDWKTKKTNPAADKIMRICNVLDITPYELLLETENGNDGQVNYVVLDKASEDYLILQMIRTMQEKDKKRILEYALNLIR